MIFLAIQAARAAGEIILNHYRKSVRVSLKADASPVTEADFAACAAIRSVLESSGIPVLSEEKTVDYTVRKHWDSYWLIDPLDGTRDFLDQTGEFTVNIALIEKRAPVLGVVYAPALEELAWAVQGQGAFLETPLGKTPLRAISQSKTGLCSRSQSNVLDTFFAENGIRDKNPVGSALKFIRMAQGKAGLYARFTSSKEWDTAAGQVILTEAGGWIQTPDSKGPLQYNKSDLRNSDFVVGASNWDPESVKWPEEK